MSIYRPRSQRRVLLAVLVLASVTVITLDFRSSGELFGGARGSVAGLLSPVRRSASAVISPVTGFVSGLARSGSTRAENQRLRDENAALRAQLDVANRERAEVESLKRLLALPLPGGIGTVTARVFATGTTTFEWTVEIDQGSDAGIGVGMPVVSGDGLAGQVAAVHATFSVVRLVNDPGFRVGARLEASQEVGTLGGGGDGPLSFRFLVNPQVQVTAGERVFTHGGPSSGFPADISLGKVAEDLPPSASLERVIPVEPALDLGRLQYVKVLLYKGERRGG